MLRRVKRVYWGVRVLPGGILSLDYESSLANWELNQQNQTVRGQHAHSVLVLYVVSVGMAPMLKLVLCSQLFKIKALSHLMLK